MPEAGKRSTRPAAVRDGVAVGRLLSGAALLMVATYIARLGCARFIATQAWAEALQAAAVVFLLRFGESRRINSTEVILGISLGASAGVLSALLRSWTATVLVVSVAMLLIHHPCPNKHNFEMDVAVAHSVPSLGFWQQLLATFWFVYRSAAGSGVSGCLGTAFAHTVMLVSAAELVAILSVPNGATADTAAGKCPVLDDVGSATGTDPRVMDFLALQGAPQAQSAGQGAAVISPTAMWASSARQVVWSPKGGGGPSSLGLRASCPPAASQIDGVTSGAGAPRRRRRSSLPPLLGDGGEELALLLPPTGRGGGRGGGGDGLIGTRASCPAVPHSCGPAGMLLRSASAAAMGAPASGGWGATGAASRVPPGGPGVSRPDTRSTSPRRWKLGRARASTPFLAVSVGADTSGTGPAEVLPEGSSPDGRSSHLRRRNPSLTRRGEQCSQESSKSRGGSPSADRQGPGRGDSDGGIGDVDDGAVVVARDQADECAEAAVLMSDEQDAIAGAEETTAADPSREVWAVCGGGVRADPGVAEEPQLLRLRYRRETGNSTHDYILLASTLPGTDGPRVYDSGFSSDDEGDHDLDEDEDDDEDNDDADDDEYDSELDQEDDDEDDVDGGASDGCFSLVIDNAGAPLGDCAVGVNRALRAQGPGQHSHDLAAAADAAACGSAEGADAGMAGEADEAAEDAAAAADAATASGPLGDVAHEGEPLRDTLGVSRAQGAAAAPAAADSVAQGTKAESLRGAPGRDPGLGYRHPTSHLTCPRLPSHAWKSTARHRRGCRGPSEEPWSSGAQACTKRGGGGGGRAQLAGAAALPRRQLHVSHPYHQYDKAPPMVYFTPPDPYGRCDVADLADFDDLMSLEEVEAAAAAEGAAASGAAPGGGAPEDFFSHGTEYWPSASAMTSLTRPTMGLSLTQQRLQQEQQHQQSMEASRGAPVRVHSTGCDAGGDAGAGRANSMWMAPAGLVERSGASAPAYQQVQVHQQQQQVLLEEASGCSAEEWPVRLAESTLAQHMAAIRTRDILRLQQQQQQQLLLFTTGAGGGADLSAPRGSSAPIPNDTHLTFHSLELMECFLRDAAILTPLPGAEGYRTAAGPTSYDDTSPAGPCLDDAAGNWEARPAASAPTAIAASAAVAATAPGAAAAAADLTALSQERGPHRHHQHQRRHLHDHPQSVRHPGDTRQHHHQHRGESSKPLRASAHGRSAGWPAGQHRPSDPDGVDLSLPMPRAVQQTPAAPEHRSRRRRAAPQRGRASVEAAGGAFDDGITGEQEQEQQQNQPLGQVERLRGRRPVRKLSQGQLFAREVYAREHGHCYGYSYGHEYGYGDVVPPKDYPGHPGAYEAYPDHIMSPGVNTGAVHAPQQQQQQQQQQLLRRLDREQRRASHRRKREGVAEAADTAAAVRPSVDFQDGAAAAALEDPSLPPLQDLQQQQQQRRPPLQLPSDEQMSETWQVLGASVTATPGSDRLRSWFEGQQEYAVAAAAAAAAAGAPQPGGWGVLAGGSGDGAGGYPAAAEWYNTVSSSGGGWGGPVDATILAVLGSPPHQLRYAASPISTPPPAAAAAGAAASAPSTPPTTVVEPFSAASLAVYRSLSGTRRYEEQDRRRGISDNYKAALAAAAAAGNRSAPGTPSSIRPPESPAAAPPPQTCSAAVTPTASRKGKCDGIAAGEGVADAGGGGVSEAVPRTASHGNGSVVSGGAEEPRVDALRASTVRGNDPVPAVAAAATALLGRSPGKGQVESESELVAASGRLLTAALGEGAHAGTGGSLGCTTAAAVEALGLRTMADRAAEGPEGEGEGEGALAAASGSTSRLTRLTLPSEGWWRQSNGDGSGFTLGALANGTGGGGVSGAAATGGGGGGPMSPCTRCSWAAVSELGEMGDDATEAGAYGSSVRGLDVVSEVDPIRIVGDADGLHAAGEASSRPSMEVAQP